MRKTSGFTLVELMIAIAVAAILLTIAAPSYRSIMIRSNLESLQDAFSTAVIMARTEAANRGQDVSVCPLGGCAAVNWEDGWIVVPGTPAAVDQDDILAQFDNRSNYPVEVDIHGGGDASVITFNAQGYNSNQERYLFSVCEQLTTPEYTWGVVVEFSGRTVAVKGEQGTLHESANPDAFVTSNFSCT